MIAIQVDEGSASKEQQKLAHGIRPLSRRDYLKVARHEMPGKWADMTRPVGNGMIRGAGLCSPSETIKQPGQPIIPYPTGQIHGLTSANGRAQSLRASRRKPILPYSNTPLLRAAGFEDSLPDVASRSFDDGAKSGGRERRAR